MPREAGPDSHMAAGPWCFAGQEEVFPGWEEKFVFAPEPLRDLAALKACARDAQLLCLRQLPALARLFSPRPESLPPIYWQTLLMPWAMQTAKQIAERWQRARAMIEAWGSRPLKLRLLPAGCSFSFASEEDFTLRGALGAEYNHWLFSRLLEASWPPAWEKIMLPPLSLPRPAPRKPHWRDPLRKLALRLPFPRLKGMGAVQCLSFSAALCHRAKSPDQSLNFAAFLAELEREEQKRPVPAQNLPAMPPLDMLPLFQAAIPASLAGLVHPRAVPPGRSPRVRGASVAAYEDAGYRQRLAIWRARGHRLFYAQHGGNYGQVAVACETELVEYSQTAFMTWGWNSQAGCQGNFIPLPYPQLQPLSASRRKARRNGRLLLVGTEMPAYPYRLDAHPTPLQLLSYRRAKAAFLEALGPRLLAHCLYRPYFDLPGTFEDAPWLLRRFPGLEICRGSLAPWLLGCRLLVADHHGTTMLEALAAGLPAIFYWDDSAWPLAPKAREDLDLLGRAGIWFACPEEAARQARRVWADPEGWWQDGPVREAWQAFGRRYALTAPGSCTDLWLKTLEKL